MFSASASAHQAQVEGGQPVLGHAALVPDPQGGSPESELLLP